jgi:hypothetical protein
MVPVSKSGRKCVEGNGIKCGHDWFILGIETATDFHFVNMGNPTSISDPASMCRKANSQAVPLWASSFKVEVGCGPFDHIPVELPVCSCKEVRTSLGLFPQCVIPESKLGGASSMDVPLNCLAML